MDSTAFPRDCGSLGYMDMYYMFISMTYIVCASITVSGAELCALHQTICGHRPPFESHGKLREKVTVRGRVALHMSGERSGC